MTKKMLQKLLLTRIELVTSRFLMYEANAITT